MAVDPSVVEVTFESALKNVEMAEDVARKVSVSAGFDEDDQHKIEMAVHESVINAIAHGNKNDSSKFVWMQFQIFRDRLEIHIRDQGKEGFDPSSLPDPVAPENLLRVSGRGIFLISTYMDEFRVNVISGSGTEVTMVKRLNSRIQPDQGGTDREHEDHSTPS